MNKESDLKDTPVNDRYAYGMHVVPPPMTGNYMPFGPDVKIDCSKFTYGPKQTSVDESYAKTIRTDAPIIEEYESDSDDDSVSNVQEDKEKPSFAFHNYVKHVKTSRENVKEKSTPNHCPKVDKQGRNGLTRKGLGYAFTRKSCFVCGIFSHLIRDCDFHEKRMAKQAELIKSKNKVSGQRENYQDDPHKALKDKGIVDGGCFRNMTGNKAHLADYQEFKGGSIAFGGSNRRITGKRKIKAGRLDFEDVYYVKELKHYNLFIVSQMCDNKNKVLFTDTDCLVLSPDFKLPDKNKVLLKIPRQHNMYSFNIKNIDPSGDLACLFAKASTDESNKWHRRLGKFDGKSDSGFLVGYSLNSKAFMVYNLETKRVAENLHVNFLENKPNVARKGHVWMFDLDYLTNSMNCKPVSIENQANKSTCSKEANNSAGSQANDDQSANSEEIDLHDKHFVLPIWYAYSTTVKSSGDKIEKTTDVKSCEKPVSQVEQIFQGELEKLKRQEKEANDAARKETTHENQDTNTNSTNLLNVVSTPVSTVGPSKDLNDGEPSYPDDPLMPHLEDIYASPSEGIFTDSSYDDEGVVTDFNNLETIVTVSPTPTTRIHTIHPKTQILGDLMSAIQTRSKVNKNSETHALSAFLYCTINEEVYVTQPPGFVDLKFPNKVYKVVKALYGLHKAPKAWYATLFTFLEKNDIIFGSTKKSWCDEFEELMKNRFQMSSMGELTFFLRLQVKQKEDGIFISQDKSIIGSLMYLTASRPDIRFTVCACSRFQVTPKTSHLQAVKRIFRYLKGQPKLGLWYPKVSSFDLEAYSDSDYAGANLDRKSTTRATLVKGRLLKVTIVKHRLILSSIELASLKQTTLGKDTSNPLIVDSLLKTMVINAPCYSNEALAILEQTAIDGIGVTAGDLKLMLLCIFLLLLVISYCCLFWATVLIKKANDVVKLRALIDEKRVIVTEDIIRKFLRFNDVDGVECLPNEEIFTELARMGYEKPPPKLTFYKAFFSAQWKFLIHTLVQCISAKRTAWNEFSCSMASVVICLATGRKFNFSKYIFDSMVRNVDNPSKFLMYLRFLQVIINAQVDDLSSHPNQYTSPALTQKVFANMRRIGKGFSRFETPLFATMLVQPQAEVEEEEEEEVPNAHTPPSPTTKPSPPLQEPITTPPQAQPAPPSSPPQEQPQPDTSKSSITLLNTLLETWGRIEAIDVDEEIILKKDDLEKAKVLQKQYVDKKENIDSNVVVEHMQEKHLDNIRKYQSLKRKPISIAQARKNMIVYLKNMVGYKMEHFKGMTYDKVRPIFEREYNKVQTLFKPDKDVDEEPTKKRVAEETLLQESLKKLKAVEVSCSHSTQDTPTDDHKEMSGEDVKNMLEIVLISEFKFEALQVKYPLIDWEIHSEGSRTYWKIIRVGGITQAYQSFEDMLKDFDREDLDVL
nr:uncharacterized mitochondrial protein AtMg00810-like [Tanacetum cinerariifolium]